MNITTKQLIDGSWIAYETGRVRTLLANGGTEKEAMENIKLVASSSPIPMIHPFYCIGKLPDHPRGYYTNGDEVVIDGNKYELTTSVRPVTDEYE